MVTVNIAGELECDYDKDPTNLYAFIEERNWKAVLEQTKTFPEEVHTFVFRTSESGLLRWRLLPIHAAILNDAPQEVLDAFLKADKTCASAKDDQGMLPLHLAIKKHQSPEAINALVAAFPDSVDEQDDKGVTPFQMAQTTSSKHKDYYQRALKRGSPTYSAITASFADLFCGVTLPKMTSDPKTAFGLLPIS